MRCVPFVVAFVYNGRAEEEEECSERGEKKKTIKTNGSYETKARETIVPRSRKKKGEEVLQELK